MTVRIETWLADNLVAAHHVTMQGDQHTEEEQFCEHIILENEKPQQTVADAETQADMSPLGDGNYRRIAAYTE